MTDENIEAIEKEKKEYLESNPDADSEVSENEEEKETELLEFSLYEDEINELIAKLVELKQTKTSIDFEIDEENDLRMNYEEEEGEEE